MNKYSYNEIAIILAFSLSSSYLLRKFFDLPSFSWWLIGGGVCFLLLSLDALTKPAPYNRKFFIPLSTIPIFCLVFYIWFENTFGEFDVGSLLFHFEMGVEGAVSNDVIKNAIKYILISLVLVGSLYYIIKVDRCFLYLDRFMAVPIFCVTPFFTYAVDRVIYNEGDLVNLYRDPFDAVSGLNSKQKNIILIYAESAERTFGDIAEGRRAFSKMADISSQGLEIRGIKQAANTGWTIAGIVSSQCGVPLQPLGLLNNNQFDKQKMFIPGISCLGEVLQKHGYHTQFINGGSLEFAGKGRFLKQHGYKVVEGLEQHKDAVSGYVNFWGLYDDTVFNLAEEQIEKLANQKSPFLYTVLTNSGHFPDGYPTKICNENLTNEENDSILFSIKCTAFHIDSFITSLRSKGLLENTLVIITSDHLIMKNTVTPLLDAQDRMNYFTVLDEQIKPKFIIKDGAMFDVFPTILELAGFKLVNRRAGIGVSLLSHETTLLEQIGQENLDALIKRDQSLSRLMWMPK